MAVNTPVDPGGRDSYWVATQDELKTIRRRGDQVIVGGAIVLLASMAVLPDATLGHRGILIGAAIALVMIAGVAWFVAARRRRIAAARGLFCARCRYAPHDTEISDMVSTRHCPRCDAEL